MGTEDDTQRDAAAKLVAAANKTLVNLQLERLRTLSLECLPAYDRMLPPARGTARPSSFAIGPSVLTLLARASGQVESGDSVEAEELDRAVESFALQLRLHRKRLRNEFDVFLSYNSEDRPEVRSIAAQLKRRGLLPWIDEEEIKPGVTWQ